MTYTVINFQTKKALKEAVARGDAVEIFNPGLGTAPDNGTAYLEGPHYPAPHRWYARAKVKEGLVTEVK